MGIRTTLTQFWLAGLLVLLAGLALPGLAQREAPPVDYADPIAGFRLTIPEDWEVDTGVVGQVEMAVDACFGATLAAQPALWFFYAPLPPEAEARAIARQLQQTLGRGVPPLVRRTGKADAWEAKITFTHPTVGQVESRWLCRQEGGVSYVIAALAGAESARKYAGALDTALESCRLIPQPARRFASEPDEGAYRLTLPAGWSLQSAFDRTSPLPGAFTWTARSADGLSGAFNAVPREYTTIQPNQAALRLAQGDALTAMKAWITEPKLAGVHTVPVSSGDLQDAVKAAFPALGSRVERAQAEYTGILDGTPVRLRTLIMTATGKNGRWYLFLSGAWAPVKDYDKLFPVARGVGSSFRISADWQQRLHSVMALAGRADLFTATAVDWAPLLQDAVTVTDPDGGKNVAVPPGPGAVWKAENNCFYRVPPDQEQAAAAQGWQEVK